METFNFDKKKVQSMELQDLKRTYRENNVYGGPMYGMYHDELIENVGNILLDKGLKMQIEEIFAANGGGFNAQGVSILPSVEEQYGKNAVEAHLLRRVYANIKVFDYDTDEFTTQVAIAWHQDGIQVAYGPCVKICHNLCILSPKRILSTSTGRNCDVNGLLEKFSEVMNELHGSIEEDMEKIQRMKEIILSPQQILCAIGSFSAMRVQHDTTNPNIRKPHMYPMNSTQIQKFIERMLLLEKEKEEITLWNMYNAVTELYKADRMEIPNMFPQHLALNEYINTYLS